MDTIANLIKAGGDCPTNFTKDKTEKNIVPIFSNGIENNGLYGYTDTATIIDKSVTISARGTIGFACVRNEPYVPIVRLITIVPDLNISLDYLALFLNATNETGSGTSTLQLTVPSIKTKLIAIPSLNEQKRISSKLSLLNKQLLEINDNHKSVIELVNIAKSKILEEIFGENSSYKSYYKNRTTTTLQQLIPKDKIGDGDWVLSENMDQNGEYSLVQLKHIGYGNFYNKSFAHINDAFFMSNNCTEIKENYILINRLIADNMNACLLPHFSFKCITAVDVCWIAPSENYDQKYLLYYLLSPQFQKQVFMKTSGTTRKRISKNNLIKLELNIHEFKYQKKIADDIDKMFNILNNIIS